MIYILSALLVVICLSHVFIKTRELMKDLKSIDQLEQDSNNIYIK